MKGKQLIRTLKHYPLASICGVLLVLLVAFIVVRGDTASQLEVREDELNSRLSKIDINAENAKGLEADVNSIEAAVDYKDERLFNRGQRAINTNFFYSLEEEADVLVTQVSQSPQEDPVLGAGGPRELKLHDVIVYSISVDGNFEGILRFLSALHHVKPYIRVADMTLSASDRRGASRAALTAKLRVLVLAKKN